MHARITSIKSIITERNKTHACTHRGVGWSNGRRARRRAGRRAWVTRVHVYIYAEHGVRRSAVYVSIQRPNPARSNHAPVGAPVGRIVGVSVGDRVGAAV